MLDLYALKVDLVCDGIITVKQYNEDNSSAFRISISYSVFKIINILICSMIWIVFALNCLFVVTLSLKHIKIRKLRLNCFIGIRYQLYKVVSNFGMTIVYFFVIGGVAGSELFLYSYNTMLMCTDTKWDLIASVIDTDTTIRICNC